MSPCRAVLTCPWSARAAALRCRRTSRSARTAARACRSARRSWIAAAFPRPPKRARSRPQLPRLRPGEIPGIRADRRAVGDLADRAGVRARHGRAQVRPARPATTSTTASAATSRGARSRRCSLLAHGYELRRRRRDRPVRLAARAPPRRLGAAARLPRRGRGRRVRGRRRRGDGDLVLGANGAALGLLAAWSMRDVLGRRAGREDESDLLGVLAIAALLVLLPLRPPRPAESPGSSAAGSASSSGCCSAASPER